MSTTFDKLHPGVQRIIWNMGWTQFRPIQDEAVGHLTQVAPADLIIAAPTASGKTEAAFLPIISSIANVAGESVKVVYISPLKALINDQFCRVQDLCDLMHIKVTMWHGEASQSQKKALLKEPGGILLITPESLEALLVNHPLESKTVFQNLSYFVIDELHVFVGKERGAQVRSLMSRIERLINKRPVRVALSATIGAGDEASLWLSGDSPAGAHLIRDTSTEERALKGIVRLYLGKIDPESEEMTSSGREEALLSHIYRGKNLVFANAKKVLEQTCDCLITICETRGLKNPYLIHHGSLSKELRLEAERRLKSESDTTVFCTNTLELGIDIGDIEEVGLLQAPYSVSSFMQRIGRSGRKENTAVTFQFLLEDIELHEQVQIESRLRLELVQALAVVELHLEGWCEPLEVSLPHLSTYVHQVLAFARENLGTSLPAVFDQINGHSFNRLLSQSQFVALMRHLKERSVLTQDKQGLVTLGPLGEKIAGHWEFYSVFQTSDEWRLVYNGNNLGSIPVYSVINVDQQVVFAGRRWEVVDIDEDRQVFLVKPAKSGGLLKFGGTGGVIHPKVHQKMREIYEKQILPPYLDSIARTALLEAQRAYSDLVLKPDSRILPTFLGSRIQNTLMEMLRVAKVRAEDFGVAIYFSGGIQELKEHLGTELQKYGKIENLTKEIKREFKIREKYDHLLPDDLLDFTYAAHCLDLVGAKQFIEAMPDVAHS